MAVDSAFFSSNDPVWVWSIRQSAAVDDKIPAPVQPRSNPGPGAISRLPHLRPLKAGPGSTPVFNSRSG
jgi:hypothetical protein